MGYKFLFVDLSSICYCCLFEKKNQQSAKNEEKKPTSKLFVS
jgi:hypothetical protein